LLTAAQIDHQVAEIIAGNAARPLDRRLDDDLVEQIYGGDPRDVRWRAFHLGLDAVDAWRTGWLRRCAGCGVRDRLVVDHDHRTGLVRGELCHGCNVSEGSHYRSDGWAAQYRQHNPAAMLGYVRYYVGARDWSQVYGDGTLWYENAARARALTGNPQWEPVPAAEW
jgi:hypothetical protein